MNWLLLLQGMLLGLLISAPVGPVNVLCVQRTLVRGRMSGIVSGLGAATADTIYGAIAGFGMSWIQDFLIREQVWFRLCGGILLLYWGYRLWHTKPVEQAAMAKTTQGFWGDYVSTFFLTIINPMTVVAFAASLVALGTFQHHDIIATLSFVAGVFLGSQLWWCILAMGTSLCRHLCVGPGRLQKVNQGAGVTLILIGVVALASLLKP